MKLIHQSYEILSAPRNGGLDLIERAGRTCYKSEEKITQDSAERFSRRLILSGHHSVIEHANMTIKFITNRGVTHELVRHRLASFSQESTRYVNYGGKDIEFIIPVWMDLKPMVVEKHMFNPRYLPEKEPVKDFLILLWSAEYTYNSLLKDGWKPEQAREVLPNALKTEIVVTANLREWRHIFDLRTNSKAHPQIRSLMRNCLKEVKTLIPVIFDDILPGGE